ncbi:MAG: hypothetical protein GXY44_02050 [Phycisphaerales bacterium]|nr:hypothetical protein [Phycisphaerales bacterium]
MRRKVALMSYFNTIIEWEGVVVDVRARYWMAHKTAVAKVGYDGPTEDEFWRLLKTGAADGQMVRFGREGKVTDYACMRDEYLRSNELMVKDELLPTVWENLLVLKRLGGCHLVTLCPNIEGVNAALNRLDVWMNFDQKRALPADRERRKQILKDMAGGQRRTLVVAGTVPLAYAAADAGLAVVGMKTGLAFPQRMRQVGVDLFFETLDELTEAMTRHDPQLERLGVL